MAETAYHYLPAFRPEALGECDDLGKEASGASVASLGQVDRSVLTVYWSESRVELDFSTGRFINSYSSCCTEDKKGPFGLVLALAVKRRPWLAETFEPR